MSICPKCNAQLADGSKFCRYCGAKLDEPAASAAPSASQPTQSNAGGKSSRYLKYANYLNDNALFNVAYAKENGYDLSEILYVGDDFGDGGGDSHIRIHGMDYIEITDYKTVKEKLQFLL